MRILKWHCKLVLSICDQYKISIKPWSHSAHLTSVTFSALKGRYIYSIPSVFQFWRFLRSETLFSIEHSELIIYKSIQLSNHFCLNKVTIEIVCPFRLYTCVLYLWILFMAAAVIGQKTCSQLIRLDKRANVE